MKKGSQKNLAKKARTPGLGRKQRVLHTGKTGDKGKTKKGNPGHSY